MAVWCQRRFGSVLDSVVVGSGSVLDSMVVGLLVWFRFGFWGLVLGSVRKSWHIVVPSQEKMGGA